jgi:ABC-type nickel/cobalt efflux system permease component RcnA
MLLAPARLLVALLAFLLLIPVGAATPTHAAPAPKSNFQDPRSAHPAPSVIHDMVVTLNKDSAQVWTRFMVSAPLVPQVLRTVDTDGDGTASPAEQQAWIKSYLAHLQITLDGQPVAAEVTRASDLNQEPLLLSMRTPVSVTLALTYTLANAEEHRFKLIDGSNYVGYDEYYISYEDSPGILVTANDTTGPGTFEAIFDVDPSAPSTHAAAPAPATAPGPARPSGLTPGADVLLSDLTTFLHDPRANLGLGLIIFGLAVLIGGIHALTPGHGKAMVAAYLVGSRGRVWDAVLLGGVVTFTHTISVIGLGLVLLLVNNFVLPAGYQAALELLSGLLIVGLGAWLLWSRWRALRLEQGAAVTPALAGEAVPAGRVAVPAPATGAQVSAFAPASPAPGAATPPHSHDGYAHTHSHDHDHDHTHPPEHTHDGHTHDHGGHVHTHVPPPGASVRDLIGLGVSGGLVPCPDALAILFLAVSVQQIGLGIALVGSFSLGLAFVLISIGVLLVKARGVLERLLPGRAGPFWARWLPLLSAAVVIVLGLFVIAGALAGRWG